jgi:hypothetical protein
MAPSSDALRPVFVVGAPRSGTHLLRFCLSRHSRVNVGPETGFFLKIYGNRHLLPPRRFPEHAEDIVDRLLRSGDPSMADVVPLRRSLVEAVRQGAADYAELAQILLGGIAAAAGKPRWGEKTPFHVLYVRQIRALFPEARILYVARESRNVVASYLRSPLLPDDLAMAVAQVRMCVRAGEAAVRAGAAMQVSYEELVGRPEATLREVARYVGEEFEAGMLKPGMRDSSFGGNIMHREEGLGIVQDPGEADKWARVLSREQGRYIQVLVDGAGGRVPASLRARVARVELRQRMMHARNRAGLHDLRLGRRPRG